MTRARRFALALVVGICCWGSTEAYAQFEPAPGFNPGAPYSSFETPPPLTSNSFTADDVEPSINRVGPPVKVNSWFLRAEYLNWNISSPHNALLGAPVFGDNVTNPNNPFLIFAPNTQTAIGYGYVPNLSGINLNDNSGIQATVGIDLVDGGEIEVSGFLLARKQSTYSIPLNTFGLFDPSVLLFQQYGIGSGVPGSASLIPYVAVTSTLVNGTDASSSLFLYNQGYVAQYLSQMWGAEANYLAEADTSELFQLQPLIGARYVNLTEHLNIYGTFVDRFSSGPPLVTTIQSTAINNVYGGQIGARLSTKMKYLELGITPKILFLGNTSANTVAANNFTIPNNGYAAYYDTVTKFTFGADCSAFANVNLTQNFSIRAGYSVLWINQVSRPYKNIYYNDAGQAGPPIGIQVVLHDFLANGFNFGCEFRY